MSSSVESAKSVPALNIDLALNCLSNSGFFNFMVEIVQEALANFVHIIDLVVAVAKEKCT
jgi:hypothetical protein